jgi:long-chain acyl-CoA synthetase
VIKVWVVLRNEYQGKIGAEELRKWCKDNMTHYKVPKLVELRDDIPKSMVGKVMRRELQEQDPLYIERKKQMQK